MIISKETMEQETFSFLKTLFNLPEIEKIAIKDVVIQSPRDYYNIKKGLELCYHDNLSDVDFNVWIRLNPEDFHGDTPIYKKYFKRLGIENKIFGITFQERLDNEDCKEGMRICLNTGFRMDLTCFTRCDENVKTLSKSDIQTNNKINYLENSWNAQDFHKVNSFWFISIQALSKLLRRDYLISDHLAHMLLMEGLLLQMLDRDNLYQTNFHRYGYMDQLDYRNVNINDCEKYFTNQDDTYNYIAKNLCKAVISYDNLVSKSNGFDKRSDIFFQIWDSYLEL